MKAKIIKGFTLIEAVMVVTIMAILATTCAVFMAGPVQNYLESARQAVLISSANSAITRIQRELVRAVPNSVRVKPTGSTAAIEFIPAVQAIRYRADSGTSAQILSFDAADSSWNAIGTFNSSVLAAQASNDDLRVVIYNQSTTVAGQDSDSPAAGINLYNSATSPGPFPAAGSQVMTPGTTQATFTQSGANEGSVSLSTPQLFPFPSPQQRMYIVDMTTAPISYVCSGGNITRYAHYTIQAVQPIAPTATNIDILANRISSCEFDYKPGSTQRAGVVIVRLNLVTDTGEIVSFIREIHLVNAP